MIGNTPVEELLEYVRAGSGMINLRDVEIQVSDTAWVSLQMPAAIKIEDKRLHLNIVQRQGESLPPEIEEILHRPRGSRVRISRQEFISARGRIDEGLSLLLDGIVPYSSEGRHNSYSGTLNLAFERISMPPEGLDNLTPPQMGQILDSVDETVPSADEVVEPAIEQQPEHVLFAILPNTKLKIKNAGIGSTITHPFRGELSKSTRNCFTCDILGGECCIEAKDHDLYIYYRKQHGDDDHPPSQIFKGILDAVGLTHGCDPFPVYQEERVSGQLIERWCTKRDDINSDCLAPMSNGRLDRLDDGRELFSCAAEFFAGDTEQAQAFSRALWLMRAACQSNTAHEIRILALCSLLEGFLAPHSGDVWRNGSPRLRGEQGWQTVVSTLGLNWDACFSDIWSSFDQFRNNMAHGFRTTSNTGDSNEILNAYSRISGGIYITIAQAMGFRGTMERSLLEGSETVTLAAP